MDLFFCVWECFREEICDIIGLCVCMMNSKSKIMCF